jgi:hypothetical protein
MVATGARVAFMDLENWIRISSAGFRVWEGKLEERQKSEHWTVANRMPEYKMGIVTIRIFIWDHLDHLGTIQSSTRGYYDPDLFNLSEIEDSAQHRLSTGSPPVCQ